MENRYVFSLRLEEGVDDRDLSEVSRLFHSLGSSNREGRLLFYFEIGTVIYVWFILVCSTLISVGIVVCQ